MTLKSYTGTVFKPVSLSSRKWREKSQTLSSTREHDIQRGMLYRNPFLPCSAQHSCLTGFNRRPSYTEKKTRGVEDNSAPNDKKKTIQKIYNHSQCQLLLTVNISWGNIIIISRWGEDSLLKKYSYLLGR